MTCYTCHRGQLVPQNIWFDDPGPQQAGGSAQMPAGQNHPAAAIVGSSSLPLDPFTPFLGADSEIRVQSTDGPAGRQPPFDQADGVDLRADDAHVAGPGRELQLLPQYPRVPRLGAEPAAADDRLARHPHGARPEQATISIPLQKVLPANRLGPALGDAPKVNCATCHNGVYKPLFGVSMAQGFPELSGAQVK